MSRAMLVSLAVLLLVCVAAGANTRPNIIFLLTDDQDSLLGGLEDMPETLKLLREGGREYKNAVVDTPICCPSRTSTLSGLYGHNLGQQALGNWCGNFTGHPIENATWITALHDAGYVTSMSGKYHNAPPQKFVPNGWDDFFSLNNECQYYNNTFNSNGTHVVYGDSPQDYMTSLIGNRSLAFIRNALAGSSPFLAYIAPHASHMPTTPAPWYMDAPLPTLQAPRTPQYNNSGEGKHWVIAGQPPLSDRMAESIDNIYAMRHRALLSVDDIVKEVADVLRAAGQLDNTYWMYTSDHGYNLGTFRMPVEKFHFFEADIHVPFLLRGPGVPPNTTSSALISNIDIGATLLELAGVPPAATPTDGRSFAREATGVVPTLARDRTVIEYGRWGSGYIVRGPCARGCGVCTGGGDPRTDDLDRLVDAPSDVYSGLRIINATHNLAYAEWSGGPKDRAWAQSTNWTECYDLNADPWQLTNLALLPAQAPMMAQLSKELWDVALCKTTECP